MAKKRVPTFEQKMAARKAANASASENPEVIQDTVKVIDPYVRNDKGVAIARKDGSPLNPKKVQKAVERTKKVVLRKPVSREVAQEAPQPRKPAAPAKPVVEGQPSGKRITDGGKAPGLGGVNESAIATLEIERSLQPHSQSEADWLKNQLDVQDEINDSGKGSDWYRRHTQSPFEYVQEHITPNEDAASAWLKDSKGKPLPSHVRLGLPHTQGNEGIYSAMMKASGLQTRSITEDSTSRFAGASWNQSPTDFEVIMPDGSRRLVDVQNTYDMWGKGLQTNMNLGITKSDRGAFGRSWREASDIDTLQTILREAYKDTPGLFRSKFTMSDKGFLLPEHLATPGKSTGMGVRDFVKTEPSMFQQDAIIGGLYDGRKANAESRALQMAEGIDPSDMVSHGYYNPTLPERMYGIDLELTRDTLMPMTKGELSKLQTNKTRGNPMSAVLSGKNKSVLSLPLNVMEEIGDSKGTLDTLVSPAVKEAVNRASVARGGKQLFYGGIPEPWVKGLKTNWRGGVGATVLNGASRESGVKLGKGDYTGAATEFGTTYALGAAFEHGIKGLTKSLGKRAPGIVTRFAGGSAGSGGLLTPVMATMAAVEVADGVVEGVTGKDTIAHVNDGMVRPYYQRTTGDTRTEEQIQRSLSGPKRVYGSDKPKRTKPQMTKEAIQRASKHLSKMVPEVKPEAPTPTVKPTVTPTVKPQQKAGWQKAFAAVRGWI